MGVRIPKIGGGSRTASPRAINVSACRRCCRDLQPNPPRPRLHHPVPPRSLRLPRGVINSVPEQNEEEIVRDDDDQQEEESLGVRLALNVLRFYKTAISPLLPPACRFQPTCSVYAMDAYTKYGVGKGTVLTAWRLMRCNPFGGSGYDPVQWPPPGLEWIFDEESSINTK